jgi:hypothetical protein
MSVEVINDTFGKTVVFRGNGQYPINFQRGLAMAVEVIGGPVALKGSVSGKAFYELVVLEDEYEELSFAGNHIAVDEASFPAGAEVWVTLKGQ